MYFVEKHDCFILYLLSPTLNPQPLGLQSGSQRCHAYQRDGELAFLRAVWLVHNFVFVYRKNLTS